MVRWAATKGLGMKGPDIDHEKHSFQVLNKKMLKQQVSPDRKTCFWILTFYMFQSLKMFFLQRNILA